MNFLQAVPSYALYSWLLYHLVITYHILHYTSTTYLDHSSALPLLHVYVPVFKGTCGSLYLTQVLQGSYERRVLMIHKTRPITRHKITWNNCISSYKCTDNNSYKLFEVHCKFMFKINKINENFIVQVRSAICCLIHSLNLMPVTWF